MNFTLDDATETEEHPSTESVVDVVLIGGGIMSATLGTFLHQLQPDWRIKVFERLNSVAEESSDAWNNAGTGHSALCEMNYTPEMSNGEIDISKAVAVNEQFQITRQFWSYLVEQGILPSAKDFLTPVPHMSFVEGDSDVSFLRKRYEILSHHPLFAGMEYSEDYGKITQWAPLIMQERPEGQKIAVTHSVRGTDVNFGILTRLLFTYLARRSSCRLHTQHEVTHIQRRDEGWQITVKNTRTGKKYVVNTRFVFVGAGGAALLLLQKTGIPEAEGIGGFPVSGQFLRCTNQEIISQHHAKIYGKAPVGAPPMSVPHLDTRVIDGKHALLFGPYAGFSTRFLKQGSLTDLLRSIDKDNIPSIMAVARDNWSLTKYLIQQVIQSQKDRINALRNFIPNVDAKDWELVIAGQRVQVIKADPQKGGVLQFGTEVVNSADGTVAALLGASPGASTAASIMLTVLEKCFSHKIPELENKLRKIIPSYKQSLSSDAELCKQVCERTASILKLPA